MPNESRNISFDREAFLKGDFSLNIFVSTILQYCSYNGPVDPMYVKDPRSTNTVALSKTPRMSPIHHSSGGR